MSNISPKNKNLKMFTPRRNFLLSCWALAIFLVAESSSICIASSVSWRPVFWARNTVGTASSPALEIRGGDVDSDAEDTLRLFLSQAKETGKFHVQGWRWHTMSVMREAERLQKLAQQMDQQNLDLSRLRRAADYVLDFNLKALHRVEAMFFPKMKQWMSDSKVAEPEMIQAFDKVMAKLETDQKRLADLGKSITKSLSGPSPGVARTVACQSGELLHLAQSMLDREINLVIPVVGLCVPEKDQKKFNNQVIKFLGVLESRVHLVHMHEVVAEANSQAEEELWKESIPSLPRSMVPRWKRTLYEPKASALVMP